LDLPTGDACFPPLKQPFLWGARWDQIGYTDTGFTSDYLTLSPRSPTGGMGAVGQIVEFAYSHDVPNNKYVAKLVDMHVAGVREIVRTQMEQAFRLESPRLAGTGPVGYAWVDVYATDQNDPNAYGWDNETGEWEKPEFNVDDPDAKFDFRQVPYNVTNLNFWRDLGRYAADEFRPVPAVGFVAADLEGLDHFAITDQAIDGFDDYQLAAIRQWVQDGGHLVLTDGAIQFFDRSGLTQDAAGKLCTYLGYTDLEEPRSHPLVAGVDWNARTTGEASAIGIGATEGDARNYPTWGLDPTADLDMDVVGTTGGGNGGGLGEQTAVSSVHGDHMHGPTQPASNVQEAEQGCTPDAEGALASLGRVRVGSGTIDFLGGALPMPTQAYDHRYGLADYSVSALTYWVLMNSLGGEIEYAAIDEPFIPTYDFDPIYGNATPEPEGDDQGGKKKSPGVGLGLLVGILAAAVAIARRKA
jgi:hypothetical protein